MKHPDCLKCNARVRCATNGQHTAYFIRETIKDLRALLAIVTACPKRKKWDENENRAPVSFRRNRGPRVALHGRSESGGGKR